MKNSFLFGLLIITIGFFFGFSCRERLEGETSSEIRRNSLLSDIVDPQAYAEESLKFICFKSGRITTDEDFRGSGYGIESYVDSLNQKGCLHGTVTALPDTSNGYVRFCCSIKGSP